MRKGSETGTATRPTSKKTLIPIALATAMGASLAYDSIATEVDSARLQNSRAEAQMVINGRDKVLGIIGRTSMAIQKKFGLRSVESEPTSATLKLGNHQFVIGQRTNVGDVLIHPDGTRFLVGSIDEIKDSVEAVEKE